MNYAKIIVKGNYEKRGDLVLRSYIRALKKINANELVNGDNAFIFGIVDEQGRFYEFFTKNVIDYDSYITIPLSEYADVCFIVGEKKELITKVVEKTLFNKDNDLDIEISNNIDLARDRAIELDAYEKHLSRINPYQRLTSTEENDCNNFQNKLKEIKKIRLQDSFNIESDEYEVREYQERPNPVKDYEYLVFEVPEEKNSKAKKK